MSDHARGSERLSFARRIGYGKLFLLVVFGLALLLFLAHAIWTGRLGSEVNKRVAALRAAGEPLHVDDFAETAIPDGQNLVTLLRAAGDVYRRDPQREQDRNDLEQSDPHAFLPPLRDAELALLRAELADNAEALALVASADRVQGVYWGSPMPTLAGPMSGEFTTARYMANLLRSAARVAAHERRWVDALEAIDDVESIPTALRGRPSLVSTLVGIGVHALAADAAIELAPGLEGGEPERAAARRLIARLLDDRRLLELFRIGLRGERFLMHDALQSTLKPPAAGAARPRAPLMGIGGNPFSRYLGAPLVHRADLRILDYNTESIRIADAPTLAELRSRYGTLDAMSTEIHNSNLDILAAIAIPSINRSQETVYRSITERHLAAVALATRLYALDHAGGLPPTLEALVPTYLPAVPLDAIDGRPLRYDPKRAIAWAVGHDGKDGGGDETTRRPELISRWSTADAVVHLIQRPRPAPPATQPEE